MNTTKLTDVVGELQTVWDMISADAGPCSKLEAAELVLDRVSGDTGKLVDELISEYGYNKVLRATATTVFG